ncbi:Zinc finger CCHC-type, partial [Trinorchestia longiramus]
MEGYATMLHDVEREREEDLLDWVACASDIDESAIEDEQDGEWKTIRNSWKGKGKPVEESERQEGGKKKMHTSADGAECNVKERSNDNLCPSGVNKNASLERADASTNAQSNSGKEKGEKGRAFKPNLGFNVTKTMQSEDSKVILVRPIGMEARTFTTGPVALAKGIAVERLGKWTGNCSQPVSQMQSWGVIKGIHQSVNVEDIKASADCGSSELLSVARLPRYSEGIKEESSAVKLGFAGTQCPSHIYVGFTRYAVFPFNAPPRRCYRCQRLGHVAVNCNSPLRCLVCSGPHTKDVCTAEPGQEKCANCHQTHIAGSKECPAIRNAAAIQKLQLSGVDFEAAKHKFRLPAFSSEEPQMWFTQAEISFRQLGITDEETKFCCVSTALPTKVAVLVDQFITNPQGTEPYTVLKKNLLTKLQLSASKRIQSLVDQSRISCASSSFLPSMVLSHIRKVAAGVDLSDVLLREYFTSRLPSHVQPFMVQFPDDKPLDELAALADKLFELSPEPPQGNIAIPVPITPAPVTQVAPVVADPAVSAHSDLSLREEIRSLALAFAELKADVKAERNSRS